MPDKPSKKRNAKASQAGAMDADTAAPERPHAGAPNATDTHAAAPDATHPHTEAPGEPAGHPGGQQQLDAHDHGGEAAEPGTPWTRYRAHLKQRYEHVWRRPEPDSLPAAMRAARPLVVAEALALLIIGFSLDDLHVLRVPGFLAGMVAAVAVLIFAGIAHGASWAARLGHLDPDRLATALDQRRSFGRAALTIVAFVFVAWLVVFSSGVPPWSA